MSEGIRQATALSASPSSSTFFLPIRAARSPPGTLKTANAMKTKNGIMVAMTLLIWNCVRTASDKGPMASAIPMAMNARKIGMVLKLIACSPFLLLSAHRRVK